MSFKQTQCVSFLGGLLDGMVTVVTLIMMFVYSPKLATIALVVMVLYGLIRAVMYNPLRQATEENIVQGAKQQSHFLETLRGLKTIKFFNRQAGRQTRKLVVPVYRTDQCGFTCAEIAAGLATGQWAVIRSGRAAHYLAWFKNGHQYRINSSTIGDNAREYA